MRGRYRITLNHYKRRLQQRADDLNRQRPLQPYLANMVEGKHNVSILDIGSGPFSLIGTVHPKMKINLIAADILAPQWNAMIRDAGIVPIITIEQQNMESLTYEDSSFDLVHCVNSLEHTQDPKSSLKEMLRVCKLGGNIYLRHFRNQGEKHNYRGLHFWNIDQCECGDCIIWNKEDEFHLKDLDENFKTELRVESPHKRRKTVIVTLRKT